MTEKINWSLQVRVAHGPQIAATGVVDVEAYDKVSVEIAAGESQQVDLVPSGTERVGMVLIVPATPSADLLYEIDGTAIALDGAHAFLGAGAARLLVCVALHRRRLDRGHAAATLWPDAPDSRAAGNLRSALWRLNQAHVGLIGVDRHHLAFRPGVLVDIDLVTAWAGRLIAGRPAGADLTALPTGGILFDLLPGWYDDWVLTERERVRQRVLHGMEAMSRQLVTAGRCAEAVEVALTAAGAEPLRESA
ncbi:AfsR/SARP family transcriptional regulator [Micromonospora chersina]|uniref:AfsR/SARP family transcriptional regulator n=1 Tax=Micromonospora chersina TaxID=47854 RepID=UPI0033AF3C34